MRNLSAIGEQYVDLQPASDGGPVLEAGSVIPVSRTSTPVPVEELVVSLDDFVRSVPLDSLRTVVDELGTAFADTGQPLQKLLDTTDAFTEDAVEALPQTLRLIRDGRTVLTTQNEVAGSFQSFSRGPCACSPTQLAESDPDLRRLIGDRAGGLAARSGPCCGRAAAGSGSSSPTCSPSRGWPSRARPGCARSSSPTPGPRPTATR